MRPIEIKSVQILEEKLQSHDHNPIMGNLVCYCKYCIARVAAYMENWAAYHYKIMKETPL